MLNFFLENDLTSPKKSGFRTGDSCINQLLSINYEILGHSDIGLQVRVLLVYLYTRCVLSTKNNELNK